MPRFPNNNLDINDSNNNINVDNDEVENEENEEELLPNESYDLLDLIDPDVITMDEKGHIFLDGKEINYEAYQKAIGIDNDVHDFFLSLMQDNIEVKDNVKNSEYLDDEKYQDLLESSTNEIPITDFLIGAGLDPSKSIIEQSITPDAYKKGITHLFNKNLQFYNLKVKNPESYDEQLKNRYSSNHLATIDTQIDYLQDYQNKILAYLLGNGDAKKAHKSFIDPEQANNGNYVFDKNMIDNCMDNRFSEKEIVQDFVINNTKNKDILTTLGKIDKAIDNPAPSILIKNAHELRNAFNLYHKRSFFQKLIHPIDSYNFYTKSANVIDKLAGYVDRDLLGEYLNADHKDVKLAEKYIDMAIKHGTNSRKLTEFNLLSNKKINALTKSADEKEKALTDYLVTNGGKDEILKDKEKTEIFNNLSKDFDTAKILIDKFKDKKENISKEISDNAQINLATEHDYFYQKYLEDKAVFDTENNLESNNLKINGFMFKEDLNNAIDDALNASLEETNIKINEQYKEGKIPISIDLNENKNIQLSEIKDPEINDPNKKLEI